MDSRRLRALISRLQPEFENVPFWIERLTLDLDDARQGTLDEFKDLSARLNDAGSNHFVPSWERMIAGLGGERLHGRMLLRRIVGVLRDDDLDATAKIALLDGIRRDVERFISTLNVLRKGLAPFEPDELRSGEAEVGVLFPLETVEHPDDLATEIDEFGKHLRTMWEIAGGDGEIRLRRLDNASADFFWSVTLHVGSVVAFTLWGLAQLLEKIASARKLTAEAAKLNAEAADILRRHAAEDAERSRALLVEDLLANSPDDDPGRRNELIGLVRRALAYFEGRIDQGVMFEVRGPEIAGASPKVEGDEREAVVAQIREQGAALTAIDVQLRLPLLTGDAEKQ